MGDQFGRPESLGHFRDSPQPGDNIRTGQSGRVLLVRGEGKGYYFGHPMPAAEFEHRLLSENTLLNVDISVSEKAAAAA
jgi:hypothetical protein